MRRSKSVSGVTHYYTYDGINLIKEEWGGNVMLFLYDADGSVIGMQYRNSTYASGLWDTYYYEKNLQGDIVAVYSETGTKLVTYKYDAWGNFTRTDLASNVPDVVKNNPITYRGYYYDDDLDLYYLATRYYDPDTCRFVTADDPAYLGANRNLIRYNLYAYCGNNPVNRIDPAGEFFDLILIISVVVIVIAYVIEDIYYLTDAEEDEKVIVEMPESDNGEVEIKNSYKIKTPIVRFGYSLYLNHFNEETKDYFTGTTFGLEYEWFLHNTAYYLSNGKLDNAADLNVGNTIFSDKHGGVAEHGMKISYMVISPIIALIDIIRNGGYSN